MASTAEFWLFGYGSLIWKPPPHFDRRIPGYVNGYVRRFWQPIIAPFCLGQRRCDLDLVALCSACIDMYQASEDHRGTPEAPGRVVTLIERSFWESLHDRYTVPENRVWGTAYRIEAARVKEVQEYLDIREINGYSIQYADFHPAESSEKPFKCMVYIGMPDNPQFMGVQEPQALAKHILGSTGPSGQNKEYLYMLEQALDQLSRESGDAHITDLASRVRSLEDATNPRSSGTESTSKAIDVELSKADEPNADPEQAETEKKA